MQVEALVPLTAPSFGKNYCVLAAYCHPGSDSHPNSRASQWNSSGGQYALHAEQSQPVSDTRSAHVRTGSPDPLFRCTTPAPQAGHAIRSGTTGALSPSNAAAPITHRSICPQ